jgi:DNA-directed RNA polymerase alpha subunit
LNLGFDSSPIKRVGFRIEAISALNQKNETLIFEIVTNGSISPQQALREAAINLVHKFSAIARLIRPKQNPLRNIRYQYPNQFKSINMVYKKRIIKSPFIKNKDFYACIGTSFFYSLDPLMLDLRNLDLPKERYFNLRNAGFRTLGHLLYRLSCDSHRFSPHLKKQIEQAMLNIGIFPYLTYVFNNN